MLITGVTRSLDGGNVKAIPDDNLHKHNEIFILQPSI